MPILVRDGALRRSSVALALGLTCSACGQESGREARTASDAGSSGGGTAGAGGGTVGGTGSGTGGNMSGTGGTGNAGAGAASGGSGNAAGAGSSGTGGSQSNIIVTVSPEMAYLDGNGTQAFSCTVSDDAEGGCTWAVVGGTPNGTITAEGVYTAPATLGVAQIEATSLADPNAKGTAIAVVRSASSGVPGEWANVTPRGISLNAGDFNNDNYGVQDVVVDPVRPSDLYAFVCHQGVYKSTDYGETWTGPINTGSGGEMVTAGKPWTAAIDLAMRDPATPPRLWTAAGNAAVGFLRSSDGGVSWEDFPTNNRTAVETTNNEYYANDAYSIDLNPYDSSHQIAGFHSGGVSESTDGGTTWRTVPVPDGIGGSIYPFFVDTGDRDSTRGNWVTISQSGENNGTWHTSDGGQNWTRVASFMHGHGGSQLASIGGNVAYAPGDSAGIFKTTDGGATWTNVSSTGSNSVVATPTKLYGGYGWAIGNGEVDPGLQVASRDDDTNWTRMPVPEGMINGPKRVAVTYNGTNYILVGGFWNAGIWRYIEP